MGSVREKIIRILTYLAMALAAAGLAIPAFNGYLRMNQTYTAENTYSSVLSIDMAESSNSKSYGREMRIVSVSIDGETLDLGLFDNDEWVWHEEWGYILYQNGNSHFEMTFPNEAHEVVVSYVKEPGSGIGTFSLDGTAFATIDMYRSKWKTTSFTVKKFTASERTSYIVQLALIIFGLEVLIWNIIRNLIHGSEAINETKKSIGMFDLAKGIGIISVIVWHSFEALPSSDGLAGMMQNIPLLGVAVIPVFYGLMPMFFLISGYGIRGQKVGVTARKQFGYWVKPYLIVFAGVTVVSLIRFLTDADFGAGDLRYYLLPFLTGSAHEGTLGSLEIYSIGPLWFVTALLFSWILVVWVLGLKNRKLKYGVAVAIVAAGYLMSIKDINVWCLPQTVFAAILLFIGYFIHKKKLFYGENRKKLALFELMLVGSIILGLVNGSDYSVGTGQWGSNYLLALIVSAMSGISILWLLLRLNMVLKGKALLIKNIGFNSYYIFYIHAFEWLVIPWKEIVTGMNLPSAASFALILVGRTLVISAIYFAVQMIKKVSKKQA